MKDSRAVNVEGNQEGGNKYTSNGAAEMIKEITCVIYLPNMTHIGI